MRNRVIESSKVEVADPSQTVIVVALDCLLEGSVRILPSAEEEDTVRLLENVAEHNFELQWRALLLHAFGSQVRKGLQDDLILDVEERKRPMKAGCLWHIDPLGMSRLVGPPEQSLPQII
jgi:hypothetical protein